MKATVYLDQNNTLTDMSDNIVEFTKSFIQHFSNELAVSNVDEIANIMHTHEKNGHLHKHQVVSRELYEQLQWDRYVKVGYLEQFCKNQLANCAA